jgi:hypothetical protein
MDAEVVGGLLLRLPVSAASSCAGGCSARMNILL